MRNKDERIVLRKVNEINPANYRSKGFEIVNKKHKEISAFKKTDLTPYINFFNANEIHFSSAATTKFELRIGMYVHFITGDDCWYFSVNKDKDGFEIKASSRQNAVSIYNSSLIKYFCDKTRLPIGSKFEIFETTIEHELGKVYKIDIHNPLELEKKGLFKP